MRAATIQLSKGPGAVSRAAAAMIVIVLLIAVAAGVYYYTAVLKPNTSSTTRSSSGSSESTSTSSSPLTSSSSSQQATTGSTSLPTTLTVEESEQPDSLDPGVTFETSGWEVVQQVYQGLVAPDRESYTSYVGDLADNWTVTPDGMNYTFYLRNDVTFSNGNPFTAYDVWFSIYRNLLINQAPSFIIGQNLALTNGGSLNITAADVNSINYTHPSEANLTFMGYPNQSVQVVNPYEVVFHLGHGTNGDAPYSAFLATLTTPQAAALDPSWVEANGGVIADTPNDWMDTHALGTGFYTLGLWEQGQSVTLFKNAHYWGDSVPSSQLNYALEPATIQTITIYYKPVSSMILDLKSGFAQMILAPASQLSVMQGIPGVNATILPPAFGSAQGVYLVYMDPYAFAPFQNLLVREAVSYAIDYKSIIQAVFDGLGTQWVGPVPPGFPYYNESTSGLQPYSYDPVKAAELLAQAGYRSTLPNGTVLDTSGKQFPTVPFLYNTDSPSENEVVSILQSELQSIGITISPQGLTFEEYSSVIFSSPGNSSSTVQYPFGLSFYSEDYTASVDYVTAITTPGYLGMSAYSNSTVIGWAAAAATALNDSAIVQNLQKITRTMYNEYVDIWFYVPYFMTTNKDNLAGMIPNPEGSGCAYFMFYNTVHYTS